MRQVPIIERVTVRFSLYDHQSLDDAMDWIHKQDGYKNKTVFYDLVCHSSVEVD